MKPALPAAPRPGLTPKQRRTLTLAIGLLVILIAMQLIFRHHENAYEKIARDVTVALQSNDLPTVQKYENAETATQVNRQRVGRAADALAPLGKFKNIKETSVETDARIHHFLLTFDKGTLQETIKFDPVNKIVRFHYDAPAIK